MLNELSLIVTYALSVNIFFVIVELFTGLYSDIPEHVHHFQYLFLGLEGHSALAPWMWTSQILAIGALAFLLVPRIRQNERSLAVLAVAVITAIWIEKGLGLVVAGFVPTPLGEIVEYAPTWPELRITFGVYGIGFLILTVLYKIAISVREELQG